jgi:hypothetical protein
VADEVPAGDDTVKTGLTSLVNGQLPIQHVMKSQRFGTNRFGLSIRQRFDQHQNMDSHQRACWFDCPFIRDVGSFAL